MHWLPWRPVEGARRGAIRAGVWLAWSVLLGCVAGGSLPLPTVRTPTRVSMWCRSLLPQGLGLFTRDAEEPALRVYVRDDDRWRRRDRPLANPASWFGLRRDHRLRDAEIARLLGDVPEEAWVPCRGQVTGCWPTDRSPAEVVVTGAAASHRVRRPPAPDAGATALGVGARAAPRRYALPGGAGARGGGGSSCELTTSGTRATLAYPRPDPSLGRWTGITSGGLFGRCCWP